ncbi:hypothetical protein L6164_011756 [Bauhinia variegata]|uniref:Uncharacterized protein n=1 Tax=Bauhinia variegata TaxID=167791 RepID=A0ACB9P838_BAUVA|nr:hypothetical protein L6164_011756 [Bauhinia variegata]
MVCIGARNLAAMVVFFNPSSRFRRKRSESCMAVKENIAEEDYIKAGGSELLFIQMQQNKSMDMRSKLAVSTSVFLWTFKDTHDDYIIGDILDLVVISCGPAGLALAAEYAKLGLKVGLIGPDLPFTNNYGVWEDEFKGLGFEGCIEHVWQDTIVYLDDKDPILIGRAYGRVSRHRLVTVDQEQLQGNYCNMRLGVLKYLFKQLTVWRLRWKTIPMIQT